MKKDWLRIIIIGLIIVAGGIYCFTHIKIQSKDSYEKEREELVMQIEDGSSFSDAGNADENKDYDSKNNKEENTRVKPEDNLEKDNKEDNKKTSEDNSDKDRGNDKKSEKNKDEEKFENSGENNNEVNDEDSVKNKDEGKDENFGNNNYEIKDENFENIKDKEKSKNSEKSSDDEKDKKSEKDKNSKENKDSEKVEISEDENKASDSNEAEKIEVSVSINCKNLMKDGSVLDNPKLLSYIPEDGNILAPVSFKVEKGDNAYDALKKICMARDIQLESDFTPIYNTYYVRGIGYLYERDAGERSGWIFKVNGESSDRGASSYILKDGDEIEWIYTLNGGSDI